MKKMTFILLGLLFWAGITPVHAFPLETIWDITYSYSGEDESCASAVQTADGGFVLAGRTDSNYDILIVKLDWAGNVVMERVYGDEDSYFCAVLEQTTDGGYIIAGKVTSETGGAASSFLLKLDSSFDVAWEQVYISDYSDYCYDVAQTDDDGYIICRKNAEGRLMLTKTDAEGNMEWDHSYDELGWLEGRSVYQTPDGGYMLNGQALLAGIDANGLFLKTDSEGNMEWYSLYGGDGLVYDIFYDGLQASDGGYVATGSDRSYGYIMYTVKLDSDGQLEWESKLDAQTGKAIQQTTDGGYILGGVDFTGMYVAKLNSRGTLVWEQSFSIPYTNSGCSAILETFDGGYLAAGTAYLDEDAFYAVRLESDAQVDLTITPELASIQIPAAGGSFNYDAQITNAHISGYNADFWLAVSSPGGFQYTIWEASNLNLAANASMQKEDLTQYVPGSVDPGTYTYCANLRDHNTWEMLTLDYITFEKLPGGVAPGHDFGWGCTGWEDAVGPAAAQHPAIFDLSVRPNPFNPNTVISYQLSVVSVVNLSVYDIQGRQVVTLVDGWRDAGVHEVTFDGSGLASGLYVYRLEAGDVTAQGKMVLLK